MRLKYLFCLLFVILYVTLSGCENPDIYGNKGQAIDMIKNDKNAIIAAWNSTGHDSPVNNSSAQLIAVQEIGNNTHISRFQFNTTDGKTHTSNLSDGDIANPVVLDIDNISIFIYPTPVAINYSSLSPDEKRLVDIALNNDTVKKELSGKIYVITAAINENPSNSFPWTSLQWTENGIVSIEILYPDGSIDYHLVPSVDFQNNSVSYINREKPAPR